MNKLFKTIQTNLSSSLVQLNIPKAIENLLTASGHASVSRVILSKYPQITLLKFLTFSANHLYTNLVELGLWACMSSFANSQYDLHSFKNSKQSYSEINTLIGKHRKCVRQMN